MAFGALLLYLALAVFLNSVTCLMLVAALFAGVPIYLKHAEGKRLLKDFGDAYERYRKTVSVLFPLPPRKKV
jgi:protein-S-isoprenylcysteine O-methyltransferase Ste14